MLLAVNGHMADLKKEEGGRQDVLEVLPMQLLFGESRGVEGWEVHPVELLIGESSQVVPYGGRRGREGVGGRGKRVEFISVVLLWAVHDFKCCANYIPRSWTH